MSSDSSDLTISPLQQGKYLTTDLNRLSALGIPPKVTQGPCSSTETDRLSNTASHLEESLLKIHSSADISRSPKKIFSQPDYTLAVQQGNSDQYQRPKYVGRHNILKEDSYLVEIQQVHKTQSTSIFCRIDPFYAHLLI